MRIYLLFITVFFVSKTVARPSNSKDRSGGETEEMDYEVEESPSDESMQEYDEAQVDEQESNQLEDHEEESTRQGIHNFGKQYKNVRPMLKKWNDVVESTQTEKNQGVIDSVGQAHVHPPIQKQKFNEYDYSNDNENYMRNPKCNSRNNEFDKNNIDRSSAALFNDNEIFFGTQRENEKLEQNHDHDGHDLNEQSHNYPSHKSKFGDSFVQRESLNMNRDRRQIEKNDNLQLSSTSTDKTSELFNNENDDDEAAIKRHIKKLSGDELEELLNSLSDDKKVLLNKIIENNQEYDTQNKREITKKASASDVSSLIDGGLLELSKSQGLSSQAEINTESVVGENSEKDITKPESQPENESTSTKAPDNTRDDSCESKPELNVDNVNSNENVDSEMLKSKRDTNFGNGKHKLFDESELLDNNYQDLDYLLKDQNSYCASHDELLEQPMDKESQPHNQNKRELLPTKQYSMNDIKSLEDSFPNNNCDQASQNMAGNMMPLVRVKRKNDKDTQKKTILPDDKVAYFPYNVDTDDVDNDEGNEFKDNGFYDRTSNFAKSHIDKPDDRIKRLEVQPEINRGQFSDKTRISLTGVSNNNFDDGTKSIGSDTDNVLSGVEGVDDNLMLNGGSRDRRALDGNMIPLVNYDSKRLLRSTPINVGVTAANVDTEDSNFQEIEDYSGNYESNGGQHMKIA